MKKIHFIYYYHLLPHSTLYFIMKKNHLISFYHLSAYFYWLKKNNKPLETTTLIGSIGVQLGSHWGPIGSFGDVGEFWASPVLLWLECIHMAKAFPCPLVPAISYHLPEGIRRKLSKSSVCPACFVLNLCTSSLSLSFHPVFNSISKWQGGPLLGTFQ